MKFRKQTHMNVFRIWSSDTSASYSELIASIELIRSLALSCVELFQVQFRELQDPCCLQLSLLYGAEWKAIIRLFCLNQGKNWDKKLRRQAALPWPLPPHCSQFGTTWQHRLRQNNFYTFNWQLQQKLFTNTSFFALNVDTKLWLQNIYFTTSSWQLWDTTEEGEFWS